MKAYREQPDRADTEPNIGCPCQPVLKRFNTGSGDAREGARAIATAARRGAQAQRTVGKHDLLVYSYLPERHARIHGDTRGYATRPGATSWNRRDEKHLITTTVKNKSPLSGSGYSGYPPGTVPGKCSILRHSDRLLTVAMK